MRKLWVVACREYRSTIRTKTFLMALVLMPVFMGGGIGVQALTKGRIDLDTKRVAVLDRSGKMWETISRAADERNEKDTVDEDTGKQVASRFELQQVPANEGRLEQDRLALSDQVREHKIFAFIEITPDILDGGRDAESPAMLYYSDQPAYEAIQRWLSWVVNDKVRSARLAEAGLDRQIVDQAMKAVRVENLGLLVKSETGEIEPAKPVNEIATFLVPLALVMLMWVAIILATQPLLNGVIEEKMQRISEVLLGSVPPFELMLGKLIGFVGVALTLVTLYGIGGYVVADYYGYSEWAPVHLIGWFVVFQSLAILMFGSLFLAAGACCSDLREAQNLVLPIWLVLMIPMFTLGTVLQHPASQFSVVLSLFPFATPIIMMIRMAIPPYPPLWQPIVGIIGTLVTTLICVWAAGRIFRIGLLMQGKAPKFTDMVKWVVRG